MKIAYLVLTHGNPKLTGHLISQLAGAQAYFIVHVDRKTDITPFLPLAQRFSNVHFCRDRINGAWADFSLVQATLNAMTDTMQIVPDVERLVLLSGATLPVQPRSYIERFFALDQQANYMEAFAMPDEQFGKPLGRLQHYWIRCAPPMARYRRRLQKMIIAYAPLRDYKPAFNGMQAMAGSQWWSITGQACRHILEFVQANPAFLRFCRHTDCPDEHFLQTILWNSSFRQTLRPSITYTEWKPGSHSPETMSQRHIDLFNAARVMNAEHHNSPLPAEEVLFARKFDEKQWDLVEQLARDNAAKDAVEQAPYPSLSRTA